MQKLLTENRGANDIPNSVGRVISADAGDTTLVNLGAGYQYRQLKLAVDVFNLFDSKSNDIAYYYTSRLSGEPIEGVDGVLKHPVMPRQVRVTASISF